MWGHGNVTGQLVTFVLFNKEFSLNEMCDYCLFPLLKNTSRPFFKWEVSQASSFIESLCSITAVCCILS